MKKLAKAALPNTFKKYGKSYFIIESQKRERVASSAFLMMSSKMMRMMMFQQCLTNSIKYGKNHICRRMGEFLERIFYNT